MTDPALSRLALPHRHLLLYVYSDPTRLDAPWSFDVFFGPELASLGLFEPIPGDERLRLTPLGKDVVLALLALKAARHDPR